MSSESHWYVAIDGQPHGPLPFAELQQEVGAGRVTRQTLLWTPGMANWGPAGEIPGLWQPAAAVPQVPAEAAPQAQLRAARSRIIAKPTSIEEAHEAIGRGALAGYVFAGMYVLGGALSYAAGYDFAWRQTLSGEDAINTLIGFLVIAVLIAGLSYWFKERGSIAIPVILGLWFVGELAIKLSSPQRFNPFWIVFYGFVAAGFISGFRGALFLRRARKPEEAAALNKAQEASAGATDVGARAEAGKQSAKKANFIVRHWRGELALPVSYWVLGFALNILLFVFAAGFGEGIGGADLTPAGIGLALLVFFGFILLVTVWQSVGIWRSAGTLLRRVATLSAGDVGALLPLSRVPG